MAIHSGIKKKRAKAKATKGEAVATTTPSSTASSTSLLVWKFIAVLAVGIILLMATDTIELKLTSTVGGGGDSGGGEGILGTVQEKDTSPAQQHAATKHDKNGDKHNPTGTDTTTTADATANSPTADTTATRAATHRAYQRRGQPMSDEDRQAMIAKWGSWTLVDDKARPKEDYFQAYPNRDIPRDKFPSNAWQIDSKYLAKFLPESLALVERTQKAILAEYGQPIESLSSGGNMFDVEHIPHEDLPTATGLDSTGARGRWTGRDSCLKGGWTTPKSWEGLKRRLLHALMTQDNFIFAMAGHSAAAGHGNHFQQSYTLQVQWILEGVFARLGIRHEARNFGNGGMGTIQNSMGGASMYGPDVDMLMWDSGMTEGDAGAPDLMARQQIMSGAKVPVLWTLKATTIKELYLHAGVDVGYIGTGNAGLQTASTLEEVDALPFAIRYMKCEGDIAAICKSHAYNGRCWVDRDDVTPETKQREAPGGRASWHPGNFVHQIRGRVIAYTILQALKEAIQEWKEAPNYVLADSAWHVTERYETTRRNVQNLASNIGGCHAEYSKIDYQYMCNTPMKGRGEFTPRSYPTLSSIRSIMRPDCAINDPPPNIYSPPDVFNPDLHPPPGEVDVLNIVEAGVEYSPILHPDYVSSYYKKPKFEGPPKVDKSGKGSFLKTHPGADFCDGSVDSFCNRGADQACLLYAHNDGRNGIMIDSMSGWLVMNIPDLKYGHIELKFEGWHRADHNEVTKGWTTMNNERRRYLRDSSFPFPNHTNATKTTGIRNKQPPQNYQTRDDQSPTTTVDSSSLPGFVDETATMNWDHQQQLKVEHQQRELGGPPPPAYCDDFKLEIAVDGKITASYDKDQVDLAVHPVQRVVYTFTALNQTDYTGGVEKEVEVAIRMSGCPPSGRSYLITHVYYA